MLNKFLKVTDMLNKAGYKTTDINEIKERIERNIFAFYKVFDNGEFEIRMSKQGKFLLAKESSNNPFITDKVFSTIVELKTIVDIGNQ